MAYYLLHHGSEVVYVGRALERPLGKRLFEAHLRPIKRQVQSVFVVWLSQGDADEGNLIASNLKTMTSNAK